MGSLLRWALGRMGYVARGDYDDLKGRYDHLAAIRDDRLRLFREWDKERLELKATIAQHEQSLRDEKTYREKLQSELESVEYRNQQLLAERKQLAELLEFSERSKSNHLAHFNNMVDEKRRLEESVATQQRLLAEMDHERRSLSYECSKLKHMLNKAVDAVIAIRNFANLKDKHIHSMIAGVPFDVIFKKGVEHVGLPTGAPADQPTTGAGGAAGHIPENPGREVACGGGCVVDGGITDGSSVRGGGGSLSDGNDPAPVV